MCRLEPQLIGEPGQINITFGRVLVDVSVDEDLEGVIVTNQAIGVEMCLNNLKTTVDVSLEDRHALGDTIVSEDFQIMLMLQHGDHLDEKFVSALALKQLQPDRIPGRARQRHALAFGLTESCGKDEEISH